MTASDRARRNYDELCAVLGPDATDSLLHEYTEQSIKDGWDTGIDYAADLYAARNDRFGK